MERVLLLDLNEAGRQAIAQRYGVTQPPSGVTISGDLDLDSARRVSAIWTEMLLAKDPPSAWLDRPEYWNCRLCHTT
ncbi:MAG: hypothetical protein ACLFSI_05005 [Halorhodospira sp.]